jgi:hypothetical protein
MPLKAEITITPEGRPVKINSLPEATRNKSKIEPVNVRRMMFAEIGLACCSALP